MVRCNDSPACHPTQATREHAFKQIVWQTEWQDLVDSYRNRSIGMNLRGGPTYEYYAALALEKNYRVCIDERAAQRPKDNPLSYWRRLYSGALQGDILVKSGSVVTHSGRSRRCPNAYEIGIVHHIYIDRKKRSLKGMVSLGILRRHLQDLDLVVAVSKYWSEYLEEAGCRNVKVIYNAFDLDEFEISDQEIRSVLQANGISRSRPLVHIGYANNNKGIADAYEALRDKDYTLIITGPPDQVDPAPVRRLHLPRRDYLCLLKACDAVVAMSRVREGRSRIAHEAMLCGTPVVGSGRGGMKELLQGGGQLVCQDMSLLPDYVQHAISHREELGRSGCAFARHFDMRNFAQEWNDLMDQAVG